MKAISSSCQSNKGLPRECAVASASHTTVLQEQNQSTNQAASVSRQKKTHTGRYSRTYAHHGHGHRCGADRSCRKRNRGREMGHPSCATVTALLMAQRSARVGPLEGLLVGQQCPRTQLQVHPTSSICHCKDTSITCRQVCCTRHWYQEACWLAICL